MGKMSLLVSMVLMMVGLYAFAQSSPVATPSPVASVAPAAPAVAPAVAPSAVPSAGLIGIVVAIVAGLNVLLSSVQTIFSGLSKSEPGWLQTVSSVVLNISKWLGSNPNV